MSRGNIMDKEVIPLCDALNKLHGISTVESCCGHGKHPFRIFFIAETLDNLPPVAYFLDSWHSGQYGWSLIVTTDCSMRPVSFMIEGPQGKQGYEGAKNIAKDINDWVRRGGKR